MRRTPFATFAMVVALGGSALAADPQRQADIAARSPDVMPFRLDATTHVFTKTATGGVLRVVSKNRTDRIQTGLVRQHLHEIQSQFAIGNFAGPSHIHGADMPGLATLKAAKSGEIRISYQDVDGGAELTYQTVDARLVTALHAWFDAQLADHGAEAMEGHDHEHIGQSTPQN